MTKTFCFSFTSVSYDKRVHLLHSLVDNGITPCLTDDQISPLYNHNRHEESRVTGELKFLTVGVSLEVEYIKEQGS